MVAPVLRPTISGQVSDLGIGGVIVVTPKLYRSTWNHVRGEDLSRHLITGSVSCNPQRDNTWQLDATMTLEGWQTLTPWLDWLEPRLSALYPDGTTRTGSLGHYLIMDSPEHRGEFSGTVKLDARGPTWILGVSDFTTRVRMGSGQNRITRVKQLIEEAPLVGKDTGGSTRYSIPTHGKTFKHGKEWTRTTPRLEIINEILTGTGFFPLWDDEQGILRTRRRGTDRLLDREPVRVWTAHVPASGKSNGVTIDPRIVAAGKFPSELVGWADTTPASSDEITGVLISNDDPYSVRIQRKRRKKGHHGRGGRTYHHAHPLIDDDDTALEVATALLDILSTENTTLTITVLPDPTFVAIWETIMLGIWDLDGQEIANGKYLVHSVEYGLTHDRAMMKISVGAVEDTTEPN